MPTIAEQAPGFQADVWSAIVAPKGTPAAAVQQFNAALQTEVVVAEMKKIGAKPMPGSLAEADAFIKGEAARWGKAVRDANVQLD